jgi:O-antigen/teichoic acid export membrane protein
MAVAQAGDGFEGLRGALTGNAVGRAVQVVALLASAVVLARLLGAEGLGIVAVATAAIRLASVPVEEGVAKLCEREIAGAVGRSNPSQAIAALRFAVLGTLVLAAAGSLAVWAVLPDMPGTGPGVGPAALTLFAATVATAVLRGVLRGEGRTTRAARLTNIQSIGAPILYLAWFAGTGGLTPAMALWLHAASKVAIAPALVLSIRRYWRFRGDPGAAGAAAIPTGWVRDAAQFSLLGLVTVALTELGAILLGHLSTPEEAGLYRIAGRAFLIAGFLTLAVQQAYGPRIARDWQAGRRDALEGPARMMSVAAMGAAAGALIGFALTGRWMLAVAFGPAFVAAYVPSLVMICGAVSISYGAVAPRLLKMTGGQGIVFRASVFALVVAAGLNVALIPPFGATGCAIASVVAMTLGQVVMNRGVRRHLGFPATPDGASAKALIRRLRRTG